MISNSFSNKTVFIDCLNWRSMFVLLCSLFAFSANSFAQEQPNYSLEELKAALEEGIDVDATEADGTTLLMRAVYNRETEKARLLIEHGANVNGTNRYGITPIYLAAKQGLEGTVILMLAAGADPNATTAEGETLVMTAAQIGNAGIIRALLANDPARLIVGANPNDAESWKGQTALMWAAAEGHVDAMKELIAGGAELDQVSAFMNIAPVAPHRRQGGFVYGHHPKGRMSALHFAAREGELESVRLLIEAGADLDIVDEEGVSALVFSTLNGHMDVAVLLLEEGADPNISDNWGRTPLFVATDIHTLDANPRPAPKLMGSYNAVDVVRVALEHGADPDTILKSRLPSWIVVGGEHNGILNDGATPFFRASMSGDLEIINLLIDAGANPSLGTAEGAPGFFGPSSGNTSSFMVAAGLGWREGISRGRDADAISTMQLLLDEYDADINAANQAGNTALHGAVNRGSADIISFLALHNADFTTLNSRDLSPLDISLGQPQFSIEPKPEIEILLRQLMSAKDHSTIEEEKTIRLAKAAEEAEAAELEESEEV